MPKFLNRFAVSEELQKIITEASEYLCLISPYIKLNHWTRESLSTHLSDKQFKLIIVYGKNEDNKAKSLSDYDLDFFKSFYNVEIRYHKRLHAKIYANENKCLLTSMNLHDYSMNENIEFGILTQSKALDIIGAVGKSLNTKFIPTSLDQDAIEFCEYIIEKSQLEFKKEVQKEKSFFGLFTKYGDANEEVEQHRYGYCLRSGSKIQFNIDRPYSLEAFQIWNQFKNLNYTERYCHQCGQQSQTSKNNPLCNSCNLK